MECQRAHWPAHKEKCTDLAAEHALYLEELARADAGDVDAQWSVADRLFNGSGVLRNIFGAVRMRMRAAERGHDGGASAAKGATGATHAKTRA